MLFSTSCQSPRRLHGRVRPGIHLFSVCLRNGPVLDENNAFTNVWCAEGRLWLLVHLWYSRNTSACYNRFSETRFDKNAPTGLAMRKRVVGIFRLFYEPPFRKAWLIAINITFLFNLFRMRIVEFKILKDNVKLFRLAKVLITIPLPHKVRLSSFHLIGFHSRIWKLKPPCTGLLKSRIWEYCSLAFI